MPGSDASSRLQETATCEVIAMNSYKDPELEYRRTLLKAAAVGDVEAQRKLWTEYRVRLRIDETPTNKEAENDEAS
jgi:hypothetical protein